jgi:subtilisin-like proprotein convertase family protein
MSNRVWLLTGILLSLLSIILSQSVSAQSGTSDSSSCGSSVPEQPIPDDGRWLRICLLDPMAPEATTVTAVHLKYLIEHPDPNQLEVRLRREDVSIEQVVWEQGKAVGANEFGNSGDLIAFHGAPSEGYWHLWIRDAVPGRNGWLKGASLAVEYAPLGPLPTLLSGTPGRPTSRRLPTGVVPSQTPDRDLKKPGSGDVIPLSSSGWQEIKRETFGGLPQCRLDAH